MFAATYLLPGGTLVVYTLGNTGEYLQLGTWQLHRTAWNEYKLSPYKMSKCTGYSTSRHSKDVW